MIPRNDVTAVLAQVPLFAACSKGDLRILARHLEVVQCAAGTELIRQGDVGDSFIVLFSGRGSVWHGRRKVDSFGPGEHVGELSLLDSAPRDATVMADTDVVIGVLGARVFRAILREAPSISDKLLRALARRLRAADLRRARR